MLEVGKTATASTVVSEKNTAKTVGSGSLEVFSTPMMIALMEQAACECLASGLEDGQTSVGVQISAEHKEASPMGAQVSATAKIENIDGRKISFSVSATCADKEIGCGTHTRVIINAEKFMARL
ncbi:MAG: thioesterase family protein [Defluviitaleaceae bacterium]|nr:thioesterase family protein [Defluviitaleaceae bacterium]MCL2262610.1 thioesterase family protein [Defluviitaleaceae bacterium]